MIDMLHNPNAEEARDQAILWARHILKTPFLIFDLETTSLKDPAIVQIGVVNWTGRTMVNMLLDPEAPIEPGAFRAHGIPEERVRGICPTFGDAYGQISNVFHNYPVHLGYNYAFDAPTLDAQCSRYKVPPLLNPAMDNRCVMHAFAAFYGEWHAYYRNYRWQKLGFAADHLNLEWTGDAHDAAADCLMTLRILHAIAQSLTSSEAGRHTARELTENPAWREAGLNFRYPTGVMLWQGAQLTKSGKTVKISRQDPQTGAPLHNYVYPDTEFLLIHPQSWERY